MRRGGRSRLDAEGRLRLHELENETIARAAAFAAADGGGVLVSPVFRIAEERALCEELEARSYDFIAHDLLLDAMQRFGFGGARSVAPAGVDDAVNTAALEGGEDVGVHPGGRS